MMPGYVMHLPPEGAGTMSDFEVFVQMRRDQPFTHVGSVRAQSDELALEAAKEVFTRRENPVGLWVINRQNIVAASEEDLELFKIAYRKEYRKPSYFTKRIAARKEGLQVDDS
jgi:ring-1,2-phenylacetyl-CoA epoxidase subunit PaaB